jgi:hypothetical protein
MGKKMEKNRTTGKKTGRNRTNCFFCVIRDMVGNFLQLDEAPIHQFGESGADPPFWWSTSNVELVELEPFYKFLCSVILVVLQV